MNDSQNQSAGWQLDRHGPAAYEEYLVPAIFESWADRLVDRVAIQPDDRVLDVACGTGIVSRCVGERLGTDGTVIGLDLNERMLEVASAAGSAVQPQIEWRRGDATDLPFPAEHFDVVCCQQALQFFDDPAAALDEMYRVLEPGGRLGVSVWRPLSFNPGYVALADAFERHVGDTAATMMRSPFPAWNGETFRSFARDVGFDTFTITIEIGSVRYPSVEAFVRREAASSPLADSLSELEQEVQEAIVRDVRESIETYIDDVGIVSPMESYVLTADR